MPPIPRTRRSLRLGSSKICHTARKCNGRLLSRRGFTRNIHICFRIRTVVTTRDVNADVDQLVDDSKWSRYEGDCLYSIRVEAHASTENFHVSTVNVHIQASRHHLIIIVVHWKNTLETIIHFRFSYWPWRLQLPSRTPADVLEQRTNRHFYCAFGRTKRKAAYYFSDGKERKAQTNKHT